MHDGGSALSENPARLVPAARVRLPLLLGQFRERKDAPDHPPLGADPSFSNKPAEPHFQAFPCPLAHFTLQAPERNV